jgi:hypothetical protein
MSSTHLTGTLDVATRADTTPTITEFSQESLELGDVQVVHVSYEIASATMQEVLPPALNPSIPPHCTWLFIRATDGPFGPFALAQARVGCRAGLKPRAFTMSTFVDNEQLAKTLATGWGYRIKIGKVHISDRYDRVVAGVDLDGRSILELELMAPTQLASGATVPYGPNFNLVNTPFGLQLLQVDIAYDIATAEVAPPKLLRFDSSAWGDSQVTPTSPIIASLLHASVTVEPPRFLCDPNLPPAVGTTVLPVANGTS